MVEVVEEAVVGEAGEEAEAGAGAGVEAEEAEVRNVWDRSNIYKSTIPNIIKYV